MYIRRSPCIGSDKVGVVPNVSGAFIISETSEYILLRRWYVRWADSAWTAVRKYARRVKRQYARIFR